jgi:hypothetical protein
LREKICFVDSAIYYEFLADSEIFVDSDIFVDFQFFFVFLNSSPKGKPLFCIDLGAFTWILLLSAVTLDVSVFIRLFVAGGIGDSLAPA